MTYNVKKGLLSCNDKPETSNPCDILTEDSGSVYQHSFWIDLKWFLERLIDNRNFLEMINSFTSFILNVYMFPKKSGSKRVWNGQLLEYSAAEL